MQVQWFSLGASWAHHRHLLFASSRSSVPRGSSRYQMVMPELEEQYMLTGSWAKLQPLPPREAHPDLQTGVCLPVNCLYSWPQSALSWLAYWKVPSHWISTLGLKLTLTQMKMPCTSRQKLRPCTVSKEHLLLFLWTCLKSIKICSKVIVLI